MGLTLVTNLNDSVGNTFGLCVLERIGELRPSLPQWEECGCGVGGAIHRPLLGSNFAVHCGVLWTYLVGRWRQVTSFQRVRL